MLTLLQLLFFFFHASLDIVGFNLEGFEGVVVGKADDYEGRPTTANLPYKVKFEIDAGGKKPKKVFAHLTESEIEGIKKEG